MDAGRVFLIMAVVSFGAIRVQSQQNPGIGSRQKHMNSESDQASARAQEQNLRKPEMDKTNSPGAGVHVNPTSEKFAATMVGDTGEAKTVTLATDGALTMGAVVINNPQFFVSSSTCGGAVAANRTCVIELKFKPAQIGAQKGLLTVTDSDKSSPQMVSLTGMGISPASLSPRTTVFDTEVNGATSPKKTITLTNRSASKITDLSAGIGGTNAADFALIPESACSDTLEAHASCTYTVTFTPSAREAETGTLSVIDNGGTQTAELKGNGAGMKIKGALAYGTVANPGTKIFSLTVTNEGAMPVAVGSPVISGSNEAVFGIVPYNAGPTVYSSCANGVVMLAKGQSCTISVQFSPPAGSGKVFSATLNIYESDGKTPNTVAISGKN